MRDASPWRCDECGQKKRQTNHWFILLNGPNLQQFYLSRWEDTDPDGPRVAKHLCSENCSAKALSKWFLSLQHSRAQFCPVSTLVDEEDLIPCTLHDGHEGPHSFEVSTATYEPLFQNSGD
jgi:hypothetical protein